MSKIFFWSTLVILTLLFAGCDTVSCVAIERKKSAFRFKGTGDVVSKNQRFTENMSKYVLQRTVRIYSMCRLKRLPTVKSPLWGSGSIVYSSSRYSFILTVAHVVKKRILWDCKNYYVQRYGLNKKLIDSKPATVFKIYKGSDLALLKVEHNYKLQTYFGKRNYLGQSIYIAGFALLPQRANNTAVSFVQGSIETLNIKIFKSKTFIRYSAPIFSGLSGAAIYNTKGEIVGVVSFMVGVNTRRGFVPRPGYFFGPGVRDIKKFFGLSLF